MSPEERAAYLNAQSASAMVVAMGMVAENMQRAYRGESMAYVEENFNALVETYGIHPNAALSWLRGP